MHLGKLLCLGLGMLLANSATAQGPQYVFRVSFKDKQGSPSLSDPLVFLSQRSLDRRSAQGISVDSTDQPVVQVYLSDVLASTGAVLNTTSRWLNHCTILLEDSSQILQLQGKSYITGIDYIAYYGPGILHLKTQTKDKFEGEREGAQFKTTGSPDFYGATYEQSVVMLNGDYLHDRGYKGQGKLIAVMDEGFRDANTNPAFDSMRQSGRLVDVHNFVKNSSDVYSFESPTSNHGTSALSTMAAYVPGVYVGSAPLAQYALYCTEIGKATESELELENMLSASERADSIGADVISESLGYNEYNTPIVRKFSYSEIDGHTTVAAKAANMATSKGILFVASAGNDGGTAWNYVLTPGDADSALTVGSVNNSRQVASNSGYGPNASGRIKPDVCVLGASCYVLSGNTTPFGSNGTSFATSQLAGWAACLLQSTSKPSPYRIRKAIIESADRYTTPDNHAGYGVPDFSKAFELLGVKTPGIPDGERWSKVLSNPFRDHITLKILLPSYSEIKVSLVDISGRVLFHTEEMAHHGIVDMPIPAEGLSSGMYFLKVMTGDKQMTHKLVKY